MQRVLSYIRFPDPALGALLVGGILLATMATAGEEPALSARILATLRGHTEIVSTVAFSPDGKQILTGSFDKTLRLWETATGKEIKTFDGPAGHHDLVLSVAFRPDGHILASGSADKTAKLWDHRQGRRQRCGQESRARQSGGCCGVQPRRHAIGHRKSRRHRAYLGCGQGTASTANHCPYASHDDTGLLRGLEPRRQADCLRQPRPLAEVMERRHRNLGPGIQGYTSRRPPLPVLGASTAGLLSSLLGQGPSLAVAALVRARMDEDSEKGHRDGVFTAAFSPDGKLLASGGSDRTIKLWNVADGTVVRELVNPNLKAAAHPGWIYSLRFTPTGSRLVSAGSAPRNQGYLAVWDVADGRLLSGQELPLGAIYSVAVSPDGERLALACGPRSRAGSRGEWLRHQDAAAIVERAFAERCAFWKTVSFLRLSYAN